LKMILAGAYAGSEESDRLRREAEAVARLQHPSIVQIYAVGEHRGLPYLALEYCSGGNLAERLREGPLSAKDAARLLHPLALAVEAAHQQGIIHRDLKPANVLLAQKSEIPISKSEKEATITFSDFGFRISDFVPKITDFGLARLIDQQGQTGSGALLGT